MHAVVLAVSVAVGVAVASSAPRGLVLAILAAGIGIAHTVVRSRRGRPG